MVGRYGVFIWLVVSVTCVEAAFEVSDNENNEIEVARSLMHGLEKQLMDRIHKKYTKKKIARDKDTSELGTLKKSLKDYIENEKRSLLDDFLRSSRVIPRMPHREVKKAPRMPHREINEAPRMPHREAEDMPRMPHRELDNSPRIPHREVDSMPRMPHREIADSPRMPHREVAKSAPRMPHRELESAPRMPHREIKKSLVLNDRDMLLLQKLIGQSKEEGELQDRSGACANECKSSFDVCVNSENIIDIMEHFLDCRKERLNCFTTHPKCV